MHPLTTLVHFKTATIMIACVPDVKRGGGGGRAQIEGSGRNAPVFAAGVSSLSTKRFCLTTSSPFTPATEVTLMTTIFGSCLEVEES